MPSHSENQALLDKIASKAASLLRNNPNPSQEMTWAENRLREERLWEGNPQNHHDLESWTEQVIAQNLDLMDQSLPYIREKDLHPERAATFESLILSLVPSESGL